ncbi:hypothetical protein CEXT_538201 [Caerostris extrusa]|uniref:Uncharacterized protein n=1 Tax=Caerostris extrusa TaxID=172846 RepID=A0AAV4RC88_CAEEX|nr:hypothetical protein CEXT_538201 [Caerostris extrusa]
MRPNHSLNRTSAPQPKRPGDSNLHLEEEERTLKNRAPLVLPSSNFEESRAAVNSWTSFSSDVVSPS